MVSAADIAYAFHAAAVSSAYTRGCKTQQQISSIIGERKDEMEVSAGMTSAIVGQRQSLDTDTLSRDWTPWDSSGRLLTYVKHLCLRDARCRLLRIGAVYEYNVGGAAGRPHPLP